jgi:hypothetical protein
MTACPWENHILHHNDFAKEDDKTLKSHSPESYVNMPLPTTTAPRTCKGTSMNGSVHMSPTPSIIMQAQNNMHKSTVADTKVFIKNRKAKCILYILYYQMRAGTFF